MTCGGNINHNDLPDSPLFLFYKSLKTILKSDKIGYMMGTLPFTDDKPVFQLRPVNKNYEYSIFSPNEALSTIYNSLAYILQCAQMFHISFIQTNPSIISNMKKFRPDIDFSILHIDPVTKSSLYFDKNLEYRIGATCHWVDKNDKLIVFDEK
jgi:hypothetical protein